MENNNDNNDNNTRRSRQRQVRRNFIDAFASLTNSSKFLLLFNVMTQTAMISIGITAIVLSMSKNEFCDQPLFTYIVVFFCRLFIAMPLNVYLKLYNRSSNAGEDETVSTSDGFADNNTSTENTDNNNSNNSTQNLNQPQPQTLQQPTTVYVNMSRLSSALEFFGTLWFVGGNVWLFTSTQCSATSPWLYYTSLAYIVIGYTLILLPVILILCIIFCLPVVIITVQIVHRLTGVNLAAGLNNSRMQAARESVIKSIVTKTFDPETTDLSSDDAHCVICLGDYQKGDSMKFMPTCHHHFHSDCVDQWLRINKTCPLCVRDVEKEIQKDESNSSDSHLSRLKFWQKRPSAAAAAEASSSQHQQEQVV